jgi:hypothetical protein
MNHVQNHFVSGPSSAPAWEFRAVGVRYHAEMEGKRPKTYELGSKLLSARITSPSARTSKPASYSAFLMCRSCALRPVPGTPSPVEGRILVQILPISGRPYVPLMCNPADFHRQGRRVPPPRPAATINQVMHSKPDHFIVHSPAIFSHPCDVLKYVKTDGKRPFLHTPAPSYF